MEQTESLLIATLAATFMLMFLVWLLSLALKDASIVDIFWGLGFALIAIVSFAVADGLFARKLLITALAIIWRVRLAAHIFRRNRGKGEDFRYRAMSARHGYKFPVASLFTVFFLQGALMWIISLPLQVAQLSQAPGRLTWLDHIGAAIWAIGFLFESVGDWQLARFKSDSDNKGKVMDKGLWAYTRHPNYFGDATLWWGFFLIALATPGGIWTAMIPVIMTFLLMKVSGVALLEKTLVKTRPEYSDYARRTMAFFPWPPKREGDRN